MDFNKLVEFGMESLKDALKVKIQKITDVYVSNLRFSDAALSDIPIEMCFPVT